jgi:hypothetical protein
MPTANTSGLSLTLMLWPEDRVDLGLQKALGVGRIHKPALVEVVDKAQLRQRTELVV